MWAEESKGQKHQPIQAVIRTRVALFTWTEDAIAYRYIVRGPVAGRTVDKIILVGAMSVSKKEERLKKSSRC